MEKQFISCHSRTLFDLLDRDADGNISVKEFERFGFLFNLTVRPTLSLSHGCIIILLLTFHVERSYQRNI